MNLPLIAGSVSTLLFATSMLPMLVKAVRTKDLSSYSFSYLAMTNVANLVHSVYVFSLPLGPIWLLHGFYVTASVLMLAWFVRFRASAPAPASTPDRVAVTTADRAPDETVPTLVPV
ncbi:MULTISPECIES: hypothetical protein [unclassified Cryobacterium]|uniref:hypothetical protein n=1 Tax=unclassified Cryobacterium TaxID=2649013 RepID=UPI0014489672|nr:MULTISPECIES: hypothetical protein [unclassified Cryobacterium]